MSDQFGRQALAEAWHEVFGDFPSLAEIQLAQAVARGESNYGQAAFKNLQTGETAVINNWGAVQSGKVPCGPEGFEATDHHADGSPYQVCFRRYATAAEGAAHFLRVLCLQKGREAVRPALASGNVDAVAFRMHDSRYFELAPEKYANAIWSNVQAIARNLGEPLAAFRGDPGGSASDPLPTFSLPEEPHTAPSGSPENCSDDDGYPYTD